jgi:hypothetical protein
MNQQKISEDKALGIHFSQKSSEGEMTRFSGFIAALGDARAATGRDENGAKRPGGYLGSWLGAVGYMSLLDQIGSCFKPKGVQIVTGNTIKKALTYFTNLTNNEIDSIYALRCAFAHDFSLYNINQRDQNLTHRFQVRQGPIGQIVVLPKIRWDGNYNNMTQDNETIINLELYGDLVEDICGKLKDMAKSGDLEIVLNGGAEELLKRYSFYSRTIII